MSAKRRGLPKGTRFEILKRDKFTCQYCGAKAPDVVLHVDHIEPVSAGGSNELPNLVTACQDCNAGKSNRPLSETQTPQKQRAQLELLQDRRESMRMLCQWQEELARVPDEEVALIAELFTKRSSATFSRDGRSDVRKWMKAHGFEPILEFMRESLDRHCQPSKKPRQNSKSADCSDAHSLAWHNTSGNWGTGSTQIGPGSTVHICGTFNVAAGGCGFTTQADGASGNVITYVFETGAVLQSPVWSTSDGTAPTCGGLSILHSHIHVNGTNGILQNTLAGTSGQVCPGGPCTQSGSSIISALILLGYYPVETPIVDVTIENMNMPATYVRQPCSADVHMNTSGIFMRADAQNLTITNNTMKQGSNIQMSYGTQSGPWTVSNNLITQTGTAISAGAAVASSNVNGFIISGNTTYDAYYWWDPADDNHLNAVHLSAQQTSATITNLQEYNNNFGGNYGTVTCGAGGHITSVIFNEGSGGGGFPNIQIFNNLLTMPDGDYPTIGYIGGTTFPSGCVIANNTIVGSVYSGNPIDIGDPCNIKNNVLSTGDYWIACQNPGTNTCPLTTSDYNTFYNSGGDQFYYAPTGQVSFATWQSHSLDVHSQVTNPQLNANYAPTSASPARNFGANLSSLGIAALDFDANGNARPSSGNWDDGAFQYVSSSPPGPPPAPLLSRLRRAVPATRDVTARSSRGQIFNKGGCLPQQILVSFPPQAVNCQSGGGGGTGGSRVFDSTDNNYIGTPSSAVYNNLTNITVSFWAYPTDPTGGGGGSIAIKDALDLETPYLALNTTGGQPTAPLGIFATFNGMENSSTSTQLPVNTWSNVVITWNKGGDQIAHVYINGTEASYLSDAPQTSAPPDDSADGWYFGGDTFNDDFNGNLAEVGIWNETLSGTNIAAVAAATTGIGSIDTAHLVGYWHLCGSASPEPDSSGNSNAGTLSMTPPAQGLKSPGYTCP